MTSARFTNKPRLAALLSILGVLSVLFAVVLGISLHYQENNLRQETLSRLNADFSMIDYAVRDQLLKRNYKNTEDFLETWARSSPAVTRMKGLAPNGFEIAGFEGHPTTGETKTVAHRVVHDGRVLLTLDVEIDLGQASARMREFKRLLIILYPLVVGSLGWFLWEVVRRSAIVPMEFAQSELQRYHEHLEQTILDRTHELEREVEQHAQADRKVQQLAYFDQFTGMLNETGYIERLRDCLEHDCSGLVATIELGGIGDIIGTFGLEASELIIYETGTRLSKSLNETSILARVGQRQFKVLYVPDRNEDFSQLEGVAYRLFHTVQEPFDLMGADVYVNVFMGVSHINVETSTVKHLLTEMEIALHESLQSPSSNVVFFRNSIQERMMRSTQIVSWLHVAIERGVFKLFYQPQIDFKSGAIIGCEALIRWPANDENWISPAEFIPIAEKAGLIEDITVWTVGEACRAGASWARDHDLKLRIGINISAHEMASPDFLIYVDKFITETRIDPAQVEFEITETALMQDIGVATQNLIKIRDMGASVAIDDFGTGQASLAYLKSFPIDRLKIDQSFVRGAPGNATDQAIITSVVKLAHSLDLSVIAEGAEELEHMRLLKDLECDEVQGYFIGRPMPEREFLEFCKTYTFTMA
ncbi:MAG: GGDEF domain-containing protein [Alphaproteobacteria bacterium]|nr:GGDEF domain-containing protein [Alphaproteobacteria bacterium]